MQEVTDWALQLRYRTTAARILDAHRKFLDASVRFYEISQAQVSRGSIFWISVPLLCDLVLLTLHGGFDSLVRAVFDMTANMFDMTMNMYTYIGSALLLCYLVSTIMHVADALVPLFCKRGVRK